MSINLHLDDLLVVEGTAVVDHTHAPLSVAGLRCASFGLLYPAPVIVSPLLMPALLTSEQRNSAKPCVNFAKVVRIYLLHAHPQRKADPQQHALRSKLCCLHF